MQHIGFALVGLGIFTFLSISAVAGIVADYKKRYLEADDLAQQAFLQAWRSIRHLNSTSAFGAWLRRVAVNTWLMQLILIRYFRSWADWTRSRPVFPLAHLPSKLKAG
jgi:DNA-directed RNA polymerase specialized sigma24 family protein